jgi:hypothetical protein
VVNQNWRLDAESKSGPNQRRGRLFLDRLFLLLALVIRLRRMIMSGFGFFRCLSRLLLCTHMIATAVLLCRSPMSLRSLLVMFGGLLMQILRHWGLLASVMEIENRNKKARPWASGGRVRPGLPSRDDNPLTCHPIYRAHVVLRIQSAIPITLKCEVPPFRIHAAIAMNLLPLRAMLRRNEGDYVVEDTIQSSLQFRDELRAMQQSADCPRKLRVSE